MVRKHRITTSKTPFLQIRDSHRSQENDDLRKQEKTMSKTLHSEIGLKLTWLDNIEKPRAKRYVCKMEQTRKTLWVQNIDSEKCFQNRDSHGSQKMMTHKNYEKYGAKRYIPKSDSS